MESLRNEHRKHTIIQIICGVFTQPPDFADIASVSASAYCRKVMVRHRMDKSGGRCARILQMKIGVRRITLGAALASFFALSACLPDNPPKDILDLEMLTPVSAIIDDDNDAWTLGTDTVINPGTLNLELSTSEHFAIAGVRLPPKLPDSRFDGPSLNLMMYSDDVIQALADRIESQVGGGGSTRLARPDGTKLSEFIVSSGALDALIGVSVTYYGEAPFLKDVETALTERLGPGETVPGHTGARHWRVPSKVIIFIPEYSLFMIFADSQVSHGCIHVGGPGVIDVGGCDFDAYRSGYPQNIRIAPK